VSVEAGTTGLSRIVVREQRWERFALLRKMHKEELPRE
jgi:hypothetical protein